MFDVIAVGSNVVDVFVKTDPQESDIIRIQHGKEPEEDLVAYPIGSKILITDMSIEVGGGGTNTAVAFARLGHVTGYLGKIGKDENGLKVFTCLKKEGVSFIGTLGNQNGYSVILDSSGEDRTILTFKGCNNEFAFQEVEKKKLQAKGYYLCSMMGNSFKALEQVAAYAKKQKALVAFNPSSYLAKQGKGYLGRILSLTDILILNDEEAREMTGEQGTDEQLAATLSSLGPRIVAITRGGKGVMVYDAKAKTVLSALPAPHLNVVETTGAGDAFGSTLFAAILSGKPLKQAIVMAMLNAESVISNLGAKNILLTKAELEVRAAKDMRMVMVRSFGSKPAARKPQAKPASAKPKAATKAPKPKTAAVKVKSVAKKTVPVKLRTAKKKAVKPARKAIPAPARKGKTAKKKR